MSRYTVSPGALADLDEIWLYVASQSSMRTAERVADSLTEALACLPRIPEPAETVRI